MSPSAVSHAVKAVEERVGVPLFARTTRSVSLTDAGAELVEAAGAALSDIEEQVESLQAARDRVRGLLRLNVPTVALSWAVTPVVVAMGERYPEVRVEVFADNGLTDIVAAGFDAGIRLGEMIAEDMVAVRLTAPFRVAVVASPAYLARRGAPKTVADLRQHACIAYRNVSGGGLYAWELLDGGRDVAVTSPGPVIVNDAVYARDLALAGVGLAYLYWPNVAEDLAEGRLVEVLAEAAIEEPGLFLYFPRRASRSSKLRAYIDTAREVLGDA